MAGGGGNEDGAIYDINVTPLVDITLVLLIIMMVTAKIIAAEFPPLQLPPAVSGREVKKDFSVAIKPDGSVYIDGEEVKDDKDFVKKSGDVLKENAKIRAVIRADKDVDHGDVFKTLENLKRAGIGKIAFAVTPGSDDLPFGSSGAKP